MSEFRVDQITNQSGSRGPDIAGITTFSATSGMLMPSGSTTKRYIPSNIVESNLLLYLDAGVYQSYPGSGTLWRDLSNNNYTEQLINGVSYTTSNGGALDFDGVDDYVLIGDTIKPSNITISTWFNADDVSTAQRLARWRLYGFGLTIESNGRISADIWDSISTNIAVFSDSNYLQTNKIYNATMTFGSNTLKLYVNGQLIGQKVATGNTNSIYYVSDGTGFTISKEGAAAGGYYNGKMYTFSVYERALDASEVVQNYNALKGRFGL
jgi:hypothetical protein